MKKIVIGMLLTLATLYVLFGSSTETASLVQNGDGYILVPIFWVLVVSGLVACWAAFFKFICKDQG